MRRLAILLVVLAGIFSSTCCAQQRFALLIGNQAYVDAVGPLKNPHNDIARVGHALSEVGFTVLDPLKDATRDDMLFGVYKLAERLRKAGPGAVGFLYYTGHGIAIGGENVLVPKNVESTTDAELNIRGVRLGEILDVLKNTAPDAVHFVVLDACRNNIRGQKGAKGFAPVNDQRAGVVLAFATAAGETASDEGAGSGPYAAALAEEIVVPGRNDQAVFNAVRSRVVAVTARHQTPWTHDGLIGERVVFKETPSATLPPAHSAGPAAPSRTEVAQFCQSIATNPSMAVVQSLLEIYKGTPMAACTQARLDEMKRAQVTAVVPPPQTTPSTPARPAANVVPAPPAITSRSPTRFSDGALKIGVLNDLSSLYSSLSGQGSAWAARKAVEDFCKTTRCFEKVDVVVADHQNKPDIGSNVARQWFDVEKVDTIVDVPNSGVALAVSDITKEKNKVLLVSGAATTDLTT